MSNVFKKYKEIDNKTFEIKLYYDLGGMNYFTGDVERRGYYLSVSPVKISKLSNGLRSVSYQAFTGSKQLLLEVKRKSKKAENEALEIANDAKVEELLDYVIQKSA